MKLQIEHLEVLASFMESHTEFARGRLSVSNARSKFQELWAKLAQALNALGLGEKPIEKWQKSWSDYKGHLKKKAAEINRSQQATGGGPPVKELTELEQKILAILGTTFFMGVGVEERGINRRESVVTETLEIQLGKPVYVTSDSLPSMSKETPVQVVHSEVNSKTNQKSKVIDDKESAATSRKRQFDTQDDHDYLYFANANESTKKRKRQQDNMNNVYTETIDCLRNIRSTVDVGLGKIDKTIKEGLRELIEVIKNNKKQ